MSDQLHLNLIDVATGRPLLPALDVDHLARVIAGGGEDIQTAEAKIRLQQQEPHYGIKAGCDPEDLRSSGWGVVFHEKADPRIKAALAPLLEVRREEAGDVYRELTYRQGESSAKWLARHGSGPGPVDPKNVPYHLLLVGDPDSIPYAFQIQLDVQHSVGRIHFEDVADYHRYAWSLVAAQQPEHRLSRDVAFFAPSHDPQTHNSRENLAGPLVEQVAALDAFKLRTAEGDQANRARLSQMLGGAETPSLLFTAGHGAFAGKGHPKHDALLGGLQCQDAKYGTYSLRDIRAGLPEQQVFSGDTVADDAKLLGLIGFFFGCYTAGAPKQDMFQTYYDQLEALRQGTAEEQAFFQGDWSRPEQADTSLVAKLPQRLLAHPRGGAAAVIGHIDRAWTYSFNWEARQLTSVFESAMTHLLNGGRVGVAMEYFNQRYAEFAVQLAELMDDIKHGFDYDGQSLLRLWMGYHDARGFVVVGDPAARLHFADSGQATNRPVLDMRDIQIEAPSKDKAQADDEPQTNDYEEYAFGMGWTHFGDLKIILDDEDEEDEQEALTAADASGKEAEEPQKPNIKLVTDFEEEDAESASATFEIKTQLGDDGDYALTRWTESGVYQRVPVLENGQVNEKLWKIHKKMVKQRLGD